MTDCRIAFGNVLFGLLLCMSSISTSASVLLASAQISQSFQGSLNSIGGSGWLVGGQVHLLPDATLDRLEFELVDFQITPNLPLPDSLGITFSYLNASTTDSVGIYFSNGVNVGDITTVDPKQVYYNERNPLLGLFDSFDQELPRIRGGATWNFGGVNASGTAQIQMRAYGTEPVAVLGEPGTLWILAIGLFGLVVVVQGRKGSSPSWC